MLLLCVDAACAEHNSACGMASQCFRISPSTGPQIFPGFEFTQPGGSRLCVDAPFSKLRKSGIKRVQAGLRPNSDGKSSPISFGDRLLDYIEGGPKLRKWYGAPDQLQLLKDGTDGNNADEQDEAEMEEDRDAVLVTDADSETGQLLVVKLILKRARVKALVKDAKAATIAFGSYVEPVAGDVTDKISLKKALRGVRSVICPTQVGALSDPSLLKGVQHIVFLSQLSVFRETKGFGALFSQGTKFQVQQDEVAIAGSGVPHTIIRAASLRDEPGGQLGYNVAQGGKVTGSISREDAASVCIRALDSPPQQGLLFEVANGDTQIDDWDALLSSLNETVDLSR